MLNLIVAALLGIAPAPVPAGEHKGHSGQHDGMKHGQMKHEGPCCPPDKMMDCCKDKPMPCCVKATQSAAPKPAQAPAAEGAGGHDHDH